MHINLMNTTCIENTEPAPLFVSKREMARHLNVSVRTIDYMMAEKKIPYIKLRQRAVRFNLSKVMEHLDKIEVKAKISNNGA